MVKAKDFKFGTQLGFAKADHKITPRGKSGRDLRLEKQPNIWDSRLIFLQWLRTSTLVHILGLPKAIIKSHPEEKVGVALG